MKFFQSLILIAVTPTLAFTDDDFEKHIRPLLVERCVKCHGPTKQSGGLRLDSREFLLQGGDSGPAAIIGDSDGSLLTTAVMYEDDVRMPPDGKLEERDIARLKEWIQRGLPWPSSARPIEVPLAEKPSSDDRSNWWSFRPIARVAGPHVRDQGWLKTDIDRFVLARLEAQGLKTAALADKRTLIRRATYDLTGLPPTQEEVDDFLQDDRPGAFARVVDRLLASPAYGERWGRHWLDIVRYADTAGENTDHPIPDAWRYRNWVIESFNQDLPYNEFIREQIAGDILALKGPEDRYASRVIATGFLAIARRFDHDSDKHMHLTYEDAIDTIGKTFLGLSLGCARCHDHKYDPITAKDYYALYGILQSSRFAFPGCEAKQQPRDLSSLLSPAGLARRNEQLAAKIAALELETKQIEEAQAAIAARLQTGSAIRLAAGEVSDGGSGSFTPQEIASLNAVEVRVGEEIRLSVSPLSNYGADSTFIEWEITQADGALRWNLTTDVIDRFTTGNPQPDGYGHNAVWYFLDGRADLRLLLTQQRDLQGNVGLHGWASATDTPSVFVNSNESPIQVWTKLPPRTFFAHPAPDGPVVLAWVSPISGKVHITGRIADAHPGGPDGVGWTLDHHANNVVSDVAKRAALDVRTAHIERQRSELQRLETAYAVSEGLASNARLHLRGDPEKLGPETPRRWLEIFGGAPVPPDGGSGREQLAEWLSDEQNPLTARVMANRIWQYHFGKGLVKSPNDFGSRGEVPTHPELLDWLASQFVQQGWSIKKLHRQIMLSATYQQSVAGNPQAIQVDPNNDLYWRFDRRRLSAEELRDSLLAASGRLDRTHGGPHSLPAQETWSFTQHNPFNMIDETNKRSVYLLTLRNRRHPFFALFDGADPNATTPQRQVTTVPTQALFFLNDPFYHAQTEQIAIRLLDNPNDIARLQQLYRLAFQRLPTAQEQNAAEVFLQTYRSSLDQAESMDTARTAWAALSRICFASNEFLYLE